MRRKLHLVLLQLRRWCRLLMLEVLLRHRLCLLWRRRSSPDAAADGGIFCAAGTDFADSPILIDNARARAKTILKGRHGGRGQSQLRSGVKPPLPVMPSTPRARTPAACLGTSRVKQATTGQATLADVPQPQQPAARARNRRLRASPVASTAL
eukprot:4770698-Pleurochrysis_carterae.AAC.1